MNSSTEAWRQQAACRNVPTDEMFPNEQNKRAWADLKEMCSYCPVIADCLSFADRFENTYRGVHGMYGGLTPSERIARRVEGKERKERCAKAARAVGVERHHSRNEPLCDECQAWQGRRDADAERWAYATELIRAGHSMRYVTITAGVHAKTAERLRRELHTASMGA